MIFVNRFADYSANSIGKVDIPVLLDDDATNILKKYTKSTTDKQKFAVSDLVTTLKSCGVFGYIKGLFIPCLAASVNEAIVDVKGALVHMGDTSGYELIEKGLKTHAYDSSKTEGVGNYSINGLSTEFSVLGAFFNRSSSAYLFNLGGFTVVPGNTDTKVRASAPNMTLGSTNLTTSWNSFVLSCGAYNNCFGVINGTRYNPTTQSSDAIPAPTSLILSNWTTNIAQYFNNKDCPIAIFAIIGKKVDENTAVAVNNAISAFIDAYFTT